eukprot:4015756-Prymnesium_polylepis.1
MRKEYVIAPTANPGSHDELAALGVAQPPRHLFPRLEMATCILHRNGDERDDKLEQEHRQAQENEEEENTCQGPEVDHPV